MFGFKPKARAQRIGLLPWRGYRVICTCGYTSWAQLTQVEAVRGAEHHMVWKHGAV